MKNFTLSAIVLAGLVVAGLGSCKKPAAVAPDTTPTNTTTKNPNTAATVCDYNFDDATLTGAGWTKVFDDSFTGDLSNWFAYTGGVKNELECNEAANAQIVGGELQLTAKQETVTGPSTIGSSTQQSFGYTSASIVSNQTFGASATTPKVMIVARVKVAAGYGLTSIFNGYGQNWPTNGQINFFQVEGDDTQEYSTDYFYGTQVNQNLVTNGMEYNPADADLSACYHVYMLEWTQNSLTYSLDGKVVETTSGNYVSSLYGKPENIALSLPIGGLYYANFVPANVQPGAMHITYVKVFTSN